MPGTTPEHPAPQAGATLLGCEALGSRKARAWVYDRAAGRAFRVSLSRTDDGWAANGEPRPVLDGGRAGPSQGLPGRAAVLAGAWFAGNPGHLAEVARAEAEAEAVRAGRRLARLAGAARAARRLQRMHAARAEAWHVVLTRAWGGRDGAMDLKLDGIGASLDPADPDALLVIHGTGGHAVRRDGRTVPEGAGLDRACALAARAARRDQRLLAPLARLLAERRSEIAQAARAEGIERGLESPPPSRPAQGRPPSAPAPSVPAAIADGIAWSRCACLDGDSVRVTLHDLSRGAQVHAVARREGDSWAVRTVKAVIPFRTGRAEPSECPDLDAVVARLAGAHHLANPAEAAHAAERARRLRGTPSREETLAAGRLAALEAEHRALASRRDALVSALAKAGLAMPSLPFETLVPVEGAPFRVRVEADGGTVRVAPDNGVRAGAPGSETPLRPELTFDGKGELVESNPDWHRLRGASGGWAMWADVLARNARTAAKEILGGPLGKALEVVRTDARMAVLEDGMAGMRAGTDGTGMEP